MSRLADTLRQLRAHCGFTQEFVADKVGVSRAALSRWESSDASPHRSNRERLADFFCITTAQLDGTASVDPATVRARWLEREYEESIGREANIGAATLARFSDQAIILEAAKRFYKIVVELSKLLDDAERLDWESAADAINKTAERGKPYPKEKAYLLRVYELIGDLFGEITSRYSLYWVSRDQQDKMPSSGPREEPVDYERMTGRHARLLDRLADKQGAAYKWLSERSVSRQRFARIEDLIDATRAAIEHHE